MKTLSSILSFTFIVLCSYTFAQQMSYKAVNPNFGGNYLNYSGLLSSANAQNQFDDQTKPEFNNSPLNSFSDSVKRQILNQLTRGMMNGGTPGLGLGSGMESGTFEIGGLFITIDDTRNGSIITIIDSQTGESTEIIL